MKPQNASTILFHRFLRLCRFSLFRVFLLKPLRHCFFKSLSYDPQRTIGLLLLALLSSRHPIWSMEILQLLSAVPDSELDANQDAVNHFKSFDQSNTKKNIARAKLLIPYCFSIKPREVQKIAADYWDIKSGVSKTKGSDSISMEDLHRTHYQFLSDWFKVHNIRSPRETDRGKFYNLARQSAEAGDLKSMFILGLMYSDGYGVKQDPEQAMYWLRTAATQQHVHAQCTVGYMFFGGWGVEKDEEKGMSWLEAAAKNGSVIAKSAIEKIREGEVKGS